MFKITYESVNVVSTQTDPNKENLKTVFEYNVPGNMSKSTPPNGSSFATTYSYNTLNQLTQKISPDAGTVQYLYDKVGNLRFSKDANQSTNGKFSYNKYDALNRLVETGEYSGSGSFTQTNSDNTSFPTPSDANKIKNQQLIYDSLFIDGQHNLNGKLSKVISYRQGSIACTTLNSYNEFGKLEWLLEQVPNASDKKINYVYDIQGNITKKCVTDNRSNTFYTFYYYDMAGRLKQVYTNTIDSETGKVKEAEYTYNSAGTVQRLQLGNAQGVDYLYNERDWLTQINQQNLNSTQDPGGDGNNGIPIDKFAEVIGYNTQEHIAGGSGFNWQPQYNGNISWVITKTAGVGLQGVVYYSC
jgi:YD repeat-containing protein